MKSKILVISFSMRTTSCSDKIAKHIIKTYGNSAQFINYMSLNIPQWNEGYWSNTQQWQDALRHLYTQLDQAQGFVFIIPEYNGAASAAYAQFNLVIGNNQIYKPVLLVGVSNARGGAYPITQARAYGSKNNKLNFIPEHIIVRNCEELLNDHEAKPEYTGDDQYIKDRITYALNFLDLYAIAAVKIRAAATTDPRFSNGM
jgi:NAD(P)H-dependent FMN reductase